jgi:hypothetical protein
VAVVVAALVGLVVTARPEPHQTVMAAAVAAAPLADLLAFLQLPELAAMAVMAR